MIDFYYAHFKNSYKRKVECLVEDIERLFKIEGIETKNSKNFKLDDRYAKGLSFDLWNKINDFYYTLKLENDNISDTLKKFLIKSSTVNTEDKKFIDSFAGCGGLSLGLSNAGFKPLLVNEIDPSLLETYYFNHQLGLDSYYCDDIKRLVDGNKLEGAEFSDLDLVVGGPPCQGFSMANRQRILDDPRNVLYKQFLKLLARTHPKFFIMENVKGMMKKSHEIIEDFNSILGNEYSLRIVLLNAKDFGIPQNRERVFVIGTRLKHVDMDAVLKEINTHRFKSKQYLLIDALFGLPELKSKKERNKTRQENELIGYKFTPANNFEKNEFLEFIGGQDKYLYNHTNRYNNERDIEIFNRLPQGGNSLHSCIADIMPYSNRNHMFKDKYFKLRENDVCKTITSHMKFDCNMYIHPRQGRGLSPREAARIQTFPENYVFMGSKNTWYTQIGNAVPVKLAQVFGEVIMNQLN
jgi:DNA (cytosine-5)-methyltransferase 1